MTINKSAQELGKLGGAVTKKRGSEYFRRIGKLGLKKRYNKKNKNKSLEK